MTEPGNEPAAGSGGRGPLRTSHADREQVIDVLKTAFVQGRLDRDEFGLRVGRALASRTYADLAALTADIPARLPRPRPPEPARESVSKKAVVATAGGTAALIGMWPVMMLTPPWPPFVLPVALVWFVLAMAVPTCWLLLLHDWLDKRAGGQSAQGRPPGAGGAAPRRLAPAGPAGQLTQSGHDLRHAAEALQGRLPRPQVPGMRPPRRGDPPGAGTRSAAAAADPAAVRGAQNAVTWVLLPLSGLRPRPELRELAEQFGVLP